MKKEIWKDIPEYRGLFAVSNQGRIRSLPRRSEVITGNGVVFVRDVSDKILKTHFHKGWLSVSISTDNGKKGKIAVHRCVAKMFVANPQRYHFVTHIDGDRNNNAADNLQWSERPSQRKASPPETWDNVRKRMSSPVKQYGFDGKLIREYGSLTEAAQAVGGNPTKISEACRGIRKHIYASQWRFKKRKEEKDVPVD